MSAHTFKATRAVPTRHTEPLFGDHVAKWVEPIARVLRVPKGCGGCNRRRLLLKRIHGAIRDWVRLH